MKKIPDYKTGPRWGTFRCWYHKKITWCEVFRVYGGRNRSNVLCRVQGMDYNIRMESYLIDFDNKPNWKDDLMKRFERKAEIDRERQKQEKELNNGR